MTRPASSLGFFRSLAELFGIVLVRFRPLPRAWGTWLIVVNSASVLFLGHAEARVALVAVGAAAVAQVLIYRRKRFIRILGATHVVWIPMLAWMALRLGTTGAGAPWFHAWLVLLMATNAISLGIDAYDATRYAAGERRPYYAW